MSRATGKTHYLVEADTFTSFPRWDVLRVNPIGQGWRVTGYTDEATATEVAAFLNERAEREGQ